MIANTNSPDMSVNERSGFTYFGGTYLPHSRLYAAEDSSYPMQKIGTFAKVNNGNGSRLTVAPVGTGWFDQYAAASGQLLMLRGKFSHPTIVDDNGKAAFVYWSTVLELQLAPPSNSEDEDMFYTLVAPVATGARDPLAGVFRFNIGAGNGGDLPSYLKPSDPFDVNAINNEYMDGHMANFQLQEARLYSVRAPEGSMPFVYSSIAADRAIQDENTSPNSTWYREDGSGGSEGTVITEISEMLADALNSTPRNLVLATPDTGWRALHDQNNGQQLMLRAVYTDSNFTDPSGRPYKIHVEAVSYFEAQAPQA